MGGGVTGSTTVFGAVSTGPSPVPPAMISETVRTHVAIVLAAGKGTRMRSDVPKVLHRVGDQPLIRWALAAVDATKPARTMVVVGYGTDAVVAALPAGVEWCRQDLQLGTGHAVGVAMTALGRLEPETPVLVTAGDMPLVTADLLERLLYERASTGATMAMVTSEVEFTRGFGRVVRNLDGSVKGVVEERDADAETLELNEVNAGIYVFLAGALVADLGRLGSDNSQGELYLTDVVGMAVARGDRVSAVAADESEVIGVNTVEQLAEADELIRTRR